LNTATSNKLENISHTTLPVARAGTQIEYDLPVARAGVEVHTTSVANGIVVKPHMELRRSMRRSSLLALKTVKPIIITLVTEPPLNQSTACLTAAGQCCIETHVKRHILLTDCTRLTVMPRINLWWEHGFVSRGCDGRRS